jgi:uncharacterized tellurite resistance protein B-like protein
MQKEQEMSDNPIYSRDDLEKILASCIAIASMDGDIHKDEIRHAKEFVEANWDKDYGDINQFAASANEQAKILLSSNPLSEAIGNIAGGLSNSLDERQKDSVMTLLKEVLHADDDPHEFELGMIHIFEKHF